MTAPGNMFSDSHHQGSSDRHVQDSVAEVACASKPQEGWLRRRIRGESKYSTYSQIPYQQSTRIQLHVPKHTPAGAPPGGAALPFMSPTTRTLSILTGPHPRGRPRSPRQAAVRSSARRPSPRAGRGPPALAQHATRERGRGEWCGGGLCCSFLSGFDQANLWFLPRKKCQQFTLGYVRKSYIH